MKMQSKYFPPKDAEQAQSNMGLWNGCTSGTAYCKLDWQGGLSAFRSTRASEGLKGKHNALGLRPWELPQYESLELLKH